jgi:Raf kinase inhibitor-like YbhB/YbcL family protein
MRIAHHARIFCIAVAACSISFTSCHKNGPLVEGQSILELKIPAFASQTIPPMYTCDGSDVSPAISWGPSPMITSSFALTVVDTDTPFGFVHWVIYNIGMGTHELRQGLPKQASLSDGTQGVNDFDKVGYSAPCPPGNSPHHYVFTLYALDTKLNLPSDPTRKQLESAMKGHILAYGQFTAHYLRHQN